MPICRLQKNHALSRRGGLPPLFRLIHPQPLMTQAKQNKERFIHRRSARALSLSPSFSPSLSLFPFFPPLSLSLTLSLPLSLSSPLRRRAPSLSRYFFRLPRTHQLVLTVSFTCSLSLSSTPGSSSHLRALSLPLSVSLSYLPTLPPIFHSFSLSTARLVRSLAHMRANEID